MNGAKSWLDRAWSGLLWGTMTVFVVNGQSMGKLISAASGRSKVFRELEKPG